MAISRSAAFLILLLAFAFGCARPPGPTTDLKYFEIVQDKESCPDGGCFIEYLFTSSGIALKKQYDLPNYMGEPAMELRRLRNSSIQLLLGKAETFASANENSPDRTDSPNHFYFSGSSKTYALSFPNDPPGKFMEIFKEAEAEFAAAEPSADFYVHQYYQPVTGDTVDFHIFPDGTFVRSVFASGSNTLQSSSMQMLSEKDLSALVDMAGTATRQQYAKQSGCRVDTGLVYGYVEIKQDGRYIDTYTCGDGNGAVDTIFTFLRNGYG